MFTIRIIWICPLHTPPSNWSGSFYLSLLIRFIDAEIKCHSMMTMRPRSISRFLVSMNLIEFSRFLASVYGMCALVLCQSTKLYNTYTPSTAIHTQTHTFVIQAHPLTNRLASLKIRFSFRFVRKFNFRTNFRALIENPYSSMCFFFSNNISIVNVNWYANTATLPFNWRCK